MNALRLVGGPVAERGVLTAKSPVPILIVDDSSAKRLALKSILAPLGYLIVEADSGTAALRCVLAQDFAVILLDVCMPIMDGFETAALIRQRQQSEMTPIIFITAFQSDELRGADLYAEGAVDFIFAPVPAEELRAKVSVFAGLFRKAEELASTAREVLAQQRTELETLNETLTVIARRDPLTGLRNRRALDEDLAVLEARVSRYGHRYCMALLDVDRFKAYNDAYGHPAGDKILQAVAAQLETHIRRGDAVYRYGGEEFLCIFPEQTLVSGTVAVERMRAGVQALALPHAGNGPGVLTVSAGIAILDSAGRHSAQEVLKEADGALYRAKDKGRNQVEQPVPYAAEVVLPA